MAGTIKITNDPKVAYKKGDVVDVLSLISAYCKSTNWDTLATYVQRIPIPDAVQFITEAWGIEYVYV